MSGYNPVDAALYLEGDFSMQLLSGNDEGKRSEIQL